MVNFESDMPYLYWTFDSLGDLEQGQIQYGFDGSVWKADLIRSYEIGEAHLTFDSPADWAKGLTLVTFHLTPGGRYEYRSEGVVYEAVRADTQSHVILTGRWTETDAGKGLFIAVLPIKQGAEILLEIGGDGAGRERSPGIGFWAVIHVGWHQRMRFNYSDAPENSLVWRASRQRGSHCFEKRPGHYGLGTLGSMRSAMGWWLDYEHLRLTVEPHEDHWQAFVYDRQTRLVIYIGQSE